MIALTLEKAHSTDAHTFSVTQSHTQARAHTRALYFVVKLVAKKTEFLRIFFLILFFNFTYTNF